MNTQRRVSQGPSPSAGWGREVGRGGFAFLQGWGRLIPSGLGGAGRGELPGKGKKKYKGECTDLQQEKF